MRWEPGEVVVWREAWRGRLYCASPVRVLEDSDESIVLYLAEGTRFAFPPGGWPFGEAHPWAGRGGWTGPGLVIQHRPGTAHTVWHFWEGDDRRFAGWYVNMQEPYRRDGLSFETQDHELDIWIRADGSWEWKDEEELEDWVPRGRFTRDEVAEIRAEGERVLAEWPFPTGWEEWTPDPSWPVPELPADWARAQVRDGFLLDPDVVHLNHGSFGACPVPVFEEYQRLQRELEAGPTDFFTRKVARWSGARSSGPG